MANLNSKANSLTLYKSTIGKMTGDLFLESNADWRSRNQRYINIYTVIKGEKLMFEMDSERGYLGHVLATATVPHLHGN